MSMSPGATRSTPSPATPTTPPGSTAATLDDVVDRFTKRLPVGTKDIDKLVKAWGDAVLQQAIDTNLSVTPPPTTLVALRADLLMHVCVQLDRLVSEREAEVILRLSPSGARAVHRQMLASYEDLFDEFVLKWALKDATRHKTGDRGAVKGGNRVLLASKESLDSFMAEMTRRGKRCERDRTAKEGPYLVYVDRSFDLDSYVAKTRT